MPKYCKPMKVKFNPLTNSVIRIKEGLGLTKVHIHGKYDMLCAAIKEHMDEYNHMLEFYERITAIQKMSPDIEEMYAMLIKTCKDVKALMIFAMNADVAGYEKRLKQYKRHANKQFEMMTDNNENKMTWKIAKKNSLRQEKYWGCILKRKFGVDLASQFKCDNCVLDFIDISRKVIYECKLSFGDVVQEQLVKYQQRFPDYQIVYIIGNCDRSIRSEHSNDYIVDLTSKTIHVLQEHYESLVRTLQSGNYRIGECLSTFQIDTADSHSL